MTIYKLIADSDSFDCIETSPKDWAALDRIAGKRLGDDWTPVRITFDTTTNKAGDFPSLRPSIPVFSERAWSCLKPLIQGSVEALPLISSVGKFYAINVIDIVDCLDVKHSKLTRLSTGKVINIERYVFQKGRINHKAMFKISETVKLEVYVQEEFRTVVETNELLGLMFKNVFRSPTEN